MFLEGPSLTQANYPHSVAALSLHFAVSIAALALAVTLFVMFGMEIVTRLTQTSETDPLTGVLNRRGFDSRIAALYEGPSVEVHCHAVVMADIDHFKSVNDRHGHDAGDAILSRFARILQGAARDSDFVVRWGGEEFMIVITNSDAAGGIGIGDNDHEFLAAPAHDEIAVARGPLENAGETRQDRIAGIVAMAVVDRFEMVDIRHDDRMAVNLDARAFVKRRDTAVETAPVENAGQRIGFAGLGQPRHDFHSEHHEQGDRQRQRGDRNGEMQRQRRHRMRIVRLRQRRTFEEQYECGAKNELDGVYDDDRLL